MPKFNNHCGHSDLEYAGDIEGADLYFYFTDCWRYCIRTSDREEDYQALPVHCLCAPVVFLYPATVEERLERSNGRLAILDRFFRHTQLHRQPPP